MGKKLTDRDISDATKISILFSTLSEGRKNIAIGYLSALNDVEDIGGTKELQEV